MMVEQIFDKEILIAIIIKAEYKKDGVEFFTPDNFSQQLGYMKHPQGYKIEAHTHNKIQQNIVLTHEVLYLKSGKVKVVLYNGKHKLISKHILNSGDVILLVTGGHSIEMLENSEIIEIKQGPYNADDKVNFTPTV